MKHLFSFLIFLTPSVFFSQVLGEGTEMFAEEIKEVIKFASKEKVKAINIEANSFWAKKNKKARFVNSTKFGFETDTLFWQKYLGDKYFFKIKNNEIIDLNDYSGEYEYKTFIIDSLDYKIYKSLVIRLNKDTTFNWLRSKYSDDKKLLEESHSCKGCGDALKTMKKFEYEGDSIKYIKYSEYENNSWNIKQEDKILIRFNDSTKQIQYLVSFRKDVLENKWIKNRTTTYTYDIKNANRIIGIEKNDYLSNDLDWYQKHVLTVSYMDK